MKIRTQFHSQQLKINEKHLTKEILTKHMQGIQDTAICKILLNKIEEINKNR